MLFANIIHKTALKVNVFIRQNYKKNRKNFWLSCIAWNNVVLLFVVFKLFILEADIFGKYILQQKN